MALKEFKCLNCSGAINFDTSSQQMKCPYCDSEFEIEALQEYDDAMSEGGSDEIEWSAHEDTPWQEGEQEGMRVYSCNTCAGEIIADASTAATNCPFCGNPVVMKEQLTGSVRPDCIIPFKLDKKAAQESLIAHLSNKKLLPKCFKSTKTLDEISGVYVPFWLFDADITANMRYRATTIRMWSDSRFNYRETRHFSVIRQGEMAFDNVPVDASAKMPADLMESIEPFNTADAVDFNTAFLAGYLADKFDFESKDCIDRANERIRQSTQDAFAATVRGYTTVMPEYRGVYLNKSSVKYALLPVWVMSATWRGKQFLFAMNGQTGKFVGNLPTDWGAFWRWFAIAAIGITALINIILLIAGALA